MSGGVANESSSSSSSSSKSVSRLFVEHVTRVQLHDPRCRGLDLGSFLIMPVQVQIGLSWCLKQI
jgi:hypothetical protein